MREIIESLFSDSEHYELYLGVIETVEGIIRGFPEDTWKRLMHGEPGVVEEVIRTIYDSGLMGLGIDEKFNGMGGGLLGQVLVTDLLAQNGLSSLTTVLTSFCRAPLLNHGTASICAPLKRFLKLHVESLRSCVFGKL